jgi:autotransporter family porin
LTITSNPNIINYGGNSTVITDLLHDSNNKYHDPINGHIPDGIIVKFTSDELGSINPISGTTTNGAANTTFTGLNLGIFAVSSNIDNQTTTTNVKIITPTIIIKPISGNKGNTVNVTTNTLNSTKPIVNAETIPMEPTGVPIIPLLVGALMMVAGLANNKRKN